MKSEQKFRDAVASLREEAACPERDDDDGFPVPNELWDEATSLAEAVAEKTGLWPHPSAGGDGHVHLRWHDSTNLLLDLEILGPEKFEWSTRIGMVRAGFGEATNATAVFEYITRFFRGGESATANICGE